MKKWIIIISALVVVIVLFVVFSKGGEEKGIKVKVEKVTKGTIIEKVNGIGKLEPDLSVQISGQVAGEILEMPVKEGDNVRVGQLLVQLEKEQYEANLGRSLSSLKAARANLSKSRSNWKRVSQLADQDLASDLEKESAKADFDFQSSQVESAQANVKDARQALAKTRLVSPITGKITKLYKKIGEIAIGSAFQKDVIMTVADLATMQSRIEVDENDIVKVNIGDTAEVNIDAFPERKFTGVVREIANSANVEGLGTQQEVTNFEVRIDLLDILPKFRPGMSCNSDIITQTKTDIIRVPIQSVAVRTSEELEKKSSDDENDEDMEEAEADSVSADEPAEDSTIKENKLVEVVFIVRNDSAFAMPIKRGIGDDNYYEILEGLTVEDKVVTGPYRALSKELQDGVAVKKEKKPGRKKKQ